MSNFTGDDVYKLLALALEPMETGVPAMESWLNAHVHGPSDAGILLDTVAHTVAHVLDLEAPEGWTATFAVLKAGPDGSAIAVDAPRPVQVAGQLLTTAANGDRPTHTAVVRSIVEEGQDEFTEVLIMLLRTFREYGLSLPTGAGS